MIQFSAQQLTVAEITPAVGVTKQLRQNLLRTRTPQAHGNIDNLLSRMFGGPGRAPPFKLGASRVSVTLCILNLIYFWTYDFWHIYEPAYPGSRAQWTPDH